MSKEQEFIDAAKQYEKASEDLSAAREKLNAAMAAMDLNSFAQDTETKIVYQVVKPSGTFTYYRDLDYLRTKKESERAGTLSAKKAEEAGFKL